VTFTFDFKIYSFHHKHQVDESRKFGEIQSSSYRVQKLILCTCGLPMTLTFDLQICSVHQCPKWMKAVNVVKYRCCIGDIVFTNFYHACMHGQHENMVPLAGYR